MISVREYQDTHGRSPFAQWFYGLNAQAAAKVTIGITRIGQGHTANLKGVGSGVVEYTIDSGPCYRICFGKDGDRLVILLGGGTKNRQTLDIEAALAHWQGYKRRK
jgi:putative addiction module killer protein